MLCSLSQTETPPGWLKQWALATGDPPLLLRTFRGSPQDPPVCSYEASWLFLSFLCLSFSEINLGNTSVFHSFRQTLKHMVLWVRPLLGTDAWHPSCSGGGRNVTRRGRVFSTKRNSETNPWDMYGAGVLLPLPTIALSSRCLPALFCLPTIHSIHFLYSILPI